MTNNEAQGLVTYCNFDIPRLVDWKFKASSQLAIVLVKDDHGYKYEVHVHYATNGNGILTGANVRWQGESQHQSVVLDTQTRAVGFCDFVVRTETNGNFGRDAGTRDDI